MDFDTKFFCAGTPVTATVHIPNWADSRVSYEQLVKVPDGSAHSVRKYRTVILCHDCARHRDDGLDLFARALGERGIASLRFDFRGCGRDAARRYRMLPATEMPYDIRCAIDFCESLPFVDRDRIGMAGVGMGGMLSLRAAADGEDRIKSCAPMAVTGDTRENLCGRLGKERFDRLWQMIREDARVNAATGVSRLMNVCEALGVDGQGARDAVELEALLVPGNSAYLSLETLRDLLALNVLDCAMDVRCPVFVMHGEDDPWIGASEAQAVFDALPDDLPLKRIRIYPGAGHNLPTSENREAIFQEAADWFAETL